MKTDAYAIYYLLFIFVDKFRVDGGVHSMHLNVSDIHKLFTKNAWKYSLQKRTPSTPKNVKKIPQKKTILLLLQ